MSFLRLLLFLVLNFAALGLGGILIGNPGTNDWYQSLDKAPWTPPGWVFGAAWTTIMVTFSIFLWKAGGLGSFSELKVFYLLFGVQWLLNVIWNPVFFRWHLMGLGMIVIVSLTLLVGWFTWWGFRKTGGWGVLMLPYLVWLLIATSLNGYAWLRN